MTVPNPKFPHDALPDDALSDGALSDGSVHPLPWPDDESESDVHLDADQQAAEAVLRELTPVGVRPQFDRRMAALWDACAGSAAADTDATGHRPSSFREADELARHRWFRPMLLAAAAVAAVACGTGFWLPIRDSGHGGTGRSVANRDLDNSDPLLIRPVGGRSPADGGPAAVPAAEPRPVQSGGDRDPAEQLTGLPANGDDAGTTSAPDPGIDADLPPSTAANGAIASTDGVGPAGRGEPVGLQQTFERVANDGVVLVEGSSAYQRYRRDAVRRIVVVDPETGRSVTVSVPTQEIVVRRVESF